MCGRYWDTRSVDIPHVDKSRIQILTQPHSGEASKTDIESPSAAEKESSAILQVGVSPTTFHRFSDLPPEIRCTIWAMAWPMRIVYPYLSKPAPRSDCSSRQRCKVCDAYSWKRPASVPAVMQACREARHEIQKISKPVSTWLVESALSDHLSTSWSRAQTQEFLDNVMYRDEMVPMITQFNAKKDMVYIDPASIRRFSQIPGPLNHDDVFQAALDPEVTLSLCAGFFNQWGHPYDAFSLCQNGLRALYHRYLRPRKHIYIGVNGMPPYVLTEEGWQKAIHEGLFSGDSMETRFISANDKDLIRKYEALRHYSFQHTQSSRKNHFEEWLWSGPPQVWNGIQNLSECQVLMLQLADFLMWDMGLGYGRGGEIMEPDGHLKENHPLVQNFDLRLPDFTPDLAFAVLEPSVVDMSGLLKRLPKMRVKIPEEDSSRARLFLRRRGNEVLKRWGKSL